MKKCINPYLSRSVCVSMCALDDTRNAKIVGPGGGSSISRRMSITYPKIVACKDYDDIEVMWHPIQPWMPICMCFSPLESCGT